jgi:hypothetical protein
MKRILVFLVLLGGILVSCNKPVYKYNSDFEGTWKTDVIFDTILNMNVRSEIIIDGADGSYKNTCSPCGSELCNCVSTHYGKAVMNTSRTEMRIGSSNYSLKINEEPYQDTDGLWKMKIQGLVFIRQ